MTVLSSGPLFSPDLISYGNIYHWDSHYLTDPGSLLHLIY